MAAMMTAKLVQQAHEEYERRAKAGEVLVDYEARAEHVPLKKDQSNYGDVYTNLWDVDHPIKEFVD